MIPILGLFSIFLRIFQLSITPHTNISICGHHNNLRYQCPFSFQLKNFGCGYAAPGNSWTVFQLNITHIYSPEFIFRIASLH